MCRRTHVQLNIRLVHNTIMYSLNMLNVKCASQVTGRVFKYIDNYSFIETNRFELYPKPVDCVKVQR